ncbi:MAG: T9SS type A sorting domain-containing protein [Ignavibacteria bacterium]|nr:T9SS type A sorting domain-containing protein [Ignavibacteria bacterium]
MKNIITIFLFFLCSLLLSFTVPGDKSDVQMLDNLVVRFVTTNDYGNNLYIDNFSVGMQNNNDIGIYSFSPKDKNYVFQGVTSKKVRPAVTIINVGRNSPTGATVTLAAVGGTYNVTQTVPSIGMGSTAVVYFDSLNFDLNVSQNLRVNINWAADENHSNDTLFQETAFHTGIQRKVLMEAFTATTCGPCASQNPALDAFIQSKFDSVVAIKHHVWWPSIGDPMFHANEEQNYARTWVYSISSVPSCVLDGSITQVSNYAATIPGHFDTRKVVPTPIALTVVDTRIPGDSIKANVLLEIVSPLSQIGTFRLMVAAVERKITYATPPGSNGETIFYDVFRWAYPTTYGTPISTSVGVYNFEFKYKVLPNWVDSMMYTAVFVQNINTREVLNCNKARNWYIDNITAPTDIKPVFSDKFCYNPELEPVKPDAVFNFEGFETDFPPVGWSLYNPDDGITFYQFAVNGPSFTGTKGIRMRMFNYATVGQIDHLVSKTYDNLSLSDTIRFDYAYAQRPGKSDRLQVQVSTDGGTTFPYTIFNKAGADLGTTAAQSTAFTPSSPSQWGTFKFRIENLTGLKPSETGIPVSFNLGQNYPNPFNPSTTIGFQCSEFRFVSLKIYDILGKEVAVLVNEKLQPGTYQINFDAGKLTSGVYFYKITAGNFSDVKKMILIK